jgi:hypothetical protein
VYFLDFPLLAPPYFDDGWIFMVKKPLELNWNDLASHLFVSWIADFRSRAETGWEMRASLYLPNGRKLDERFCKTIVFFKRCFKI